jgi:adenosylcobyric acid synthase
MAKALMIQGCTSSAGKSYLTAALCRILANEGVRVAPFKAQNMSNNAGVTPAGLEMGRAQLVQAQAARVVPDVRMNPVLLKPEADTRSQVVLLGRASPELSALGWRERKPQLWPHVRAALHSLMAEYDVVVIEGAGSPAEVNLRSSDIVNMRVAQEAGAAVLLAADIDRGGAFAHLLTSARC